ncbi:putative lactocepin [Planococcus antarcticus DSM 14505]|uniref:Lactocepin n=1 Tax=Planococcus antarcticus DSM 14505 TaxID=1185653 RepID=A0AA87IMG0_9BACL|nr:S8 family serine peptidase [Planococcus antarcticus]EIM07144.1 putative lactocepin [Planococcus antarcticus DSM 14505]
MKKTGVWLMGVLLVISSVTGFSSPAVSKVPDPEVKLAQTLLKPQSPKEKVRIIIELKEEPTIEIATTKGVLYKELPDSQKKRIEADAMKKQETVQAAITKVAPKIDYLQTFTTVFNGFSAEVEAGQVAEIAELPNVKAVYEATEYKRPEVKPLMKYSKKLVQAQQAWRDYGFKGEGMIIGVIDTGIDPGHRDMVLSNNKTATLTKTQVEAFVSNHDIEKGAFFTQKVPFGYNYMDANTEIRDVAPDASMHGMHVAGTIGANGNEEKGGIKGVAPEAQLLALKVFGNDAYSASTFGDIYIKAIDDAIKLDADVINLSLGATAGFVDTSNPEQQAVERATNNGVLVAISAGNEDKLGSGFLAPFAENQDYGLIGTPGLAVDSLGVASFENDVITADSFIYKLNNVKAGRALYMPANNVKPVPNESYQIVDAGQGRPQDFTGKDVNGKFALIARGAIPFIDAAYEAEAAGAAGVIIYNNVAGPVTMEYDPYLSIPFMSTLQVDGLAMKAGLQAGKKGTVVFDGEKLETPNSNAGKMSEFTSWGPTPNLDFKPEITAPGGNIFSTLNDNGYGLMSGTSMAAPHVAGGAALVFQRVKELGLDGRDRVAFAKNLLMNTSNPVEFKKGQYVSPRRQGAGLMQLHDALSTDVMLTDQTSSEAKIALKEIKNNKITMTLQAKNFSNKAATYAVKVDVQADAVTKHKERKINVTDPNLSGSTVVTNFVKITSPKLVTVPANGVAKISVTIDTSTLKGRPEFAAFTNGFFIDGFITLTDAKADVTGNTPLVVPYFGFNGEWDNASIFDDVAWDPGTFYASTFLTDDFGQILNGGSHQQGFVPARFAFSPNGDGSRESVIPVFSLLRNAKQIEVNVLDANGKKLRTLQTGKNLVKNFNDTFPYYYDFFNEWNGEVLGKTVKDGKYQIQLRGVIDYPNAEWQSLTLPILVDTVAPTAKAALKGKTVTVTNFKDNTGGSGPDRWEILQNGVAITDDPETYEVETLAPSTTLYVLLKDLKKGDSLKAVFYDTAGNKTTVPLTGSVVDTQKPAISIISPMLLEVLNTKRVEVFGSVEDKSRITSVTVNNEKALRFDGQFFQHTLTVEDGRHDIFVKATDEAGNSLEVRSQVLVDTRPASLEILDAPEILDSTKDTAKVTFNVQDNMDAIKVYLTDSEVYSHDMSEPYGEVAFNKDITIDVPVRDPGDHEFTLKVVDAAGNVTKKPFTIMKKAKIAFTDIQSHWAKTQIEALASQNVIKGQTATLFAPQAELTRAEFATLLVRTLKLPLKESEGKFKDAGPDKTWASKEIEAAARAGIVLGMTTNTFDPKAPISRQDTAVMMIRAVEYQQALLLEGLDTTHQFADSSTISPYANEAVSQAYALGFITGREDNIFDPKAKITRGETAAVLYRALDKMKLLR